MQSLSARACRNARLLSHSPWSGKTVNSLLRASCSWCLGAIFATLGFAAPLPANAAEECAIEALDLAPALQDAFEAEDVLTARGTDPDSLEPFRRTVVALEGGSLLIVEQKHCDMYNLTVTVLDSKRAEADDIMPAILKAIGLTPTWTSHFEDTPKTAFAGLAIQTGTVGLDEAVSATRGTSEVYLHHSETSMEDSGFDSVTTIYVGVGG